MRYALQRIELYTSPAQFPWYQAVAPVTLSLPPPSADQRSPASKFTYRFAIHRAGVFHRWESPDDGPDDEQHPHGPEHHEISLHLMMNRETYTVNNVLGITGSPPNIDHIRLQCASNNYKYQSADSLHNRTGSGTFDPASFVTFH